ncbi:MAG: hypothetical protein R2682_15225 [Pyrinomonadaceae bacterium]
MPKNKIEDLRNMLFETMERLLDDTDEKMDLERAETISKVAQTVINSAKVEVEFIKQTGHGGSSFLQNLPVGKAPQLASRHESPAVYQDEFLKHSAIVRWEDCSVAEDAVLDAEILTTD